MDGFILVKDNNGEYVSQEFLLRVEDIKAISFGQSENIYSVYVRSVEDDVFIYSTEILEEFCKVKNRYLDFFGINYTEWSI